MSIDLPVAPGVADCFPSQELVDALAALHVRTLRDLALSLDAEIMQDDGSEF